MTLSHRPLQDADAEIICTFPSSAEELFFVFPEAAYPLTSRQLLSGAPAHHDPTTGILGGRIAGFVDFAAVREKKFCTLGHLVVHPECRRQGVAAYLVKIMVQTAIEKYAVRFVQASCFSHNKAAYALFHKVGFRPADMGQRLGPDAEPLLLIHMHLPARKWAGAQAGGTGS